MSIFFIIQTNFLAPNTKWDDVKKHFFFLCYYYFFSDFLSHSRSLSLSFDSFCFLFYPFISIVVRLKAMSNSFLCVHFRNLPNSRFSIWTEIIVPKTIYTISIFSCIARSVYAMLCYTICGYLYTLLWFPFSPISFKSFYNTTAQPFFHPFHFSMQISATAPFCFP